MSSECPVHIPARDNHISSWLTYLFHVHHPDPTPSHPSRSPQHTRFQSDSWSPSPSPWPIFERANCMFTLFPRQPTFSSVKATKLHNMTLFLLLLYTCIILDFLFHSLATCPTHACVREPHECVCAWLAYVYWVHLWLVIQLVGVIIHLLKRQPVTPVTWWAMLESVYWS